MSDDFEARLIAAGANPEAAAIVAAALSEPERNTHMTTTTYARHEAVVVARIPNCDLDHVEPVPAFADVNLGQGWANVCEAHWQSRTRRKLGLGLGQRYLLEGTPEADAFELAMESAPDKRAAMWDAVDAGDLDALEELVGDGDIAEWL